MSVETGSVPHGPVHLTHGEVHVWRFRTDVDEREIDRVRALLSTPERERALRHRRPDGGAEFVVSRAALRYVLSLYTDVRPGHLVFAYSPTGKPSLVPPADVAFSLTHADGVVLIAVSRDAVGIDVEALRRRPRMARIAGRFLGPETAARLAALHPSERDLAFHHAWTQHEAYVKAIGGAVLGTTETPPFLWPHSRTPQPVLSRDGELWSVLTLPEESTRVATVVAHGRIEEVLVRSAPTVPID